MAQFNFGSNAGNTAATPNFGFGAKPANQSFGAPGGTQPTGSITFGTPIASVAPTPNTSLNFGTPTPSLNFGAPATSTPGTGLAFGAQTPKSTGLSFGAPASTATSFSLGFGGGTSTSTPATGGLNFGAPAATSTGFGLGTSTTQTPGLFGATSTSAAQPSLGLSFGAPAATSASTGFNLGGTTGATPTFSLGLTTTSAGLSFGTTSTAPTALNFGAPTQTSTPSLNFSFGGAKSQAAPTLTLGTTITQAPSIGLGGVDSSQNKAGSTATAGQNQITAKENLIPNEILQTIEGFKNFVKDQKAHSSDVSRGSARPFLKVGEDIDTLTSIMSEVGNELQRNQQVAVKLKNDSAKCLHDAEMAQRTYDTPPGLQFENVAPMQYFIDLVNKFEQDLQAIRMQIDVTGKHVQSLQEPRFLTSQELSIGMRNLHDTFVALAGRLQSVHTQVESQKEQYLNLRKYILKDPTNIFLKPSKDLKSIESTLQSFSNNNSVCGPTPFSSLGAQGYSMMIAPQNQTVPNKPPPAYPANSNLSFGTPTTALPSSTLLSSASNLGGNTTMFGNTSQLGQTTDNSNFQLQNPPPGNKRGKR